MGPAVKAPGPARTVTILEAGVSGCDAELYLNGIPLALLLSSRNRSVSVPVMQYIVTGDNHVMLTVNPGATPGTALDGPDWTAPREARASFRLVSYPAGAFAGDPGGVEHLARYWTGDGQEAGTRRLEGAVDWPLAQWPTPAGPWAWESAPVLDLNGHRGHVEDFIARVHRLLEAGDAGTMLQLADHHLREVAAAYSLDLAQEQQAGTAFLAEEFAKPGWAMEPLDPEGYDLRPCAGGRLVECVRADREPILREVPSAEGEYFFYPMKIGAVGGQLRILR